MLIPKLVRKIRSPYNFETFEINVRCSGRDSKNRLILPYVYVDAEDRPVVDENYFSPQFVNRVELAVKILNQLEFVKFVSIHDNPSEFIWWTDHGNKFPSYVGRPIIKLAKRSSSLNRAVGCIPAIQAGFRVIKCDEVKQNNTHIFKLFGPGVIVHEIIGVLGLNDIEIGRTVPLDRTMGIFTRTSNVLESEDHITWGQEEKYTLASLFSIMHFPPPFYLKPYGFETNGTRIIELFRNYNVSEEAVADLEYLLNKEFLGLRLLTYQNIADLALWTYRQAPESLVGRIFSLPDYLFMDGQVLLPRARQAFANVISTLKKVENFEYPLLASNANIVVDTVNPFTKALINELNIVSLTNGRINCSLEEETELEAPEIEPESEEVEIEEIFIGGFSSKENNSSLEIDLKENCTLLGSLIGGPITESFNTKLTILIDDGVHQVRRMVNLQMLPPAAKKQSLLRRPKQSPTHPTTMAVVSSDLFPNNMTERWIEQQTNVTALASSPTAKTKGWVPRSEKQLVTMPITDDFGIRFDCGRKVKTEPLVIPYYYQGWMDETVPDSYKEKVSAATELLSALKLFTFKQVDPVQASGIRLATESYLRNGLKAKPFFPVFDNLLCSVVKQGSRFGFDYTLVGKYQTLNKNFDYTGIESIAQAFLNVFGFPMLTIGGLVRIQETDGIYIYKTDPTAAELFRDTSDHFLATNFHPWRIKYSLVSLFSVMSFPEDSARFELNRTRVEELLNEYAFTTKQKDSFYALLYRVRYGFERLVTYEDTQTLAVLTYLKAPESMVHSVFNFPEDGFVLSARYAAVPPTEQLAREVLTALRKAEKFTYTLLAQDKLMVVSAHENFSKNLIQELNIVSLSDGDISCFFEKEDGIYGLSLEDCVLRGVIEQAMEFKIPIFIDDATNQARVHLTLRVKPPNKEKYLIVGRDNLNTTYALTRTKFDLREYCAAASVPPDQLACHLDLAELPKTWSQEACVIVRDSLDSSHVNLNIIFSNDLLNETCHLALYPRPSPSPSHFLSSPLLVEKSHLPSARRLPEISPVARGDNGWLAIIGGTVTSALMAVAGGITYLCRRRWRGQRVPSMVGEGAAVAMSLLDTPQLAQATKSAAHGNLGVVEAHIHHFPQEPLPTASQSSSSRLLANSRYLEFSEKQLRPEGDPVQGMLVTNCMLHFFGRTSVLKRMNRAKAALHSDWATNESDKFFSHSKWMEKNRESAANCFNESQLKYKRTH